MNRKIATKRALFFAASLIYAIVVIAAAFRFSQLERFDLVANKAISSFTGLLEGADLAPALQQGVVPFVIPADAEAFAKMVRARRSHLHYDMGVFEMHMGGGNTFRWAQHWYRNQKLGIAYVLNPATFGEEVDGFELVYTDIGSAPEGRNVPRLIKTYVFAKDGQ